MKIALLIPDGVGIRNFVFGSFLKKLKPSTEVTAFHNIPNALLEKVAPGIGRNVEWTRLEPFEQTKLTLGLQYSLAYAQMYWADTKAMQRIRNTPVRGSWRNKALHRGTKLMGRINASPRRIKMLESWLCAAAVGLPAVAYYKQALQKLKPSIVFCTHQRPSSVVPVVLAARQLGIPTATFIFSWDNLSSKGRIAAPFDHYLVWSDHMAKELLHYYPDVSQDHVHVVGTPQFEPYSDPSLLWSREEFFRRIGGDPTRPLLCYSGGDAGTCPEDQEHVRVLLEHIRAGRIQNRPQVLVRPSPADDGKRYEAVRRDFPELIFSPPRWVHTEPGDWSRIIPMPDDIALLANITHHADLNVNLGSTMTLDFGIHDKPVVNIAFDVANPPIFGMPVWDYYYFFEHYRPVVELGASRCARSAEELAEHVNAYLRDPALDREGRRRLAEMQVRFPLDQSSCRIAEVLERISR